MSSAARKKIVEETLNRIIGNLKRGRRSKELKKKLTQKRIKQCFWFSAMQCQRWFSQNIMQFCPINRKSPYFLLVLNTKFSSIVTGDEKANAVNSKWIHSICEHSFPCSHSDWLSGQKAFNLHSHAVIRFRALSTTLNLKFTLCCTKLVIHAG